MNDDELLKALAAAAQAERARDPRYDALADDDLSEEDRAALAALGDDEAMTAFAPLDEAARERFAAAALTAMGASAAAPEPEGAKILPFRKTWAGRVLTFAVPLAAAAALAFVLLRPGPEGPGLPDYRLDATAGERTLRSAEPAPADVPRYGPGSRIELVLRPSTAAQGPVTVRGFLNRGGELQPWAVTPEVSPEGAIRIAGPVEELLPDVTGEVELLLAVGRPEALPDAGEVLTATPKGWRLLRYRLVRLPGG
jgi:hypothetical protein